MRCAETETSTLCMFEMKNTESSPPCAEQRDSGVVHLFNGLMDARKERAPVIAIAGDVETMLMDTSSLEEMNPYKFFEAASLYTARLVNPAQAHAVIGTAIRTSIIEKGPTVLSIPGDVAAAEAVGGPAQISIPAAPVFCPSDSDLSRLTEMIND